MIHISYDSKGLEQTISGTIPVIFLELETVIRSIKDRLISDIGEVGSKELMQEVFNNSMLTEDERDIKASEEIKNADEETSAEFDTWFKKFMKEGN